MGLGPAQLSFFFRSRKGGSRGRHGGGSRPPAVARLRRRREERAAPLLPASPLTSLPGNNVAASPTSYPGKKNRLSVLRGRPLRVDRQRGKSAETAPFSRGATQIPSGCFPKKKVSDFCPQFQNCPPFGAVRQEPCGLCLCRFATLSPPQMLPGFTFSVAPQPMWASGDRFRTETRI